MILMAILRASEIREMSEKEIDEKVAELRNELLKERAKASAVGVPENPGRIRAIKRTIARILTVKHERKLTSG